MKSDFMGQDMHTSPTATGKPVLGVIAHHLLRIQGVREIRQEAPVAVFAPPDSPLLEMADYCCPVPSLDMTDHEFDRIIDQAINRGIELGGILAIRDGNVYGAAAACHKRGLPSPPLEVLRHVRSKSAFRSWLCGKEGSLGCRRVRWRHLPKGLVYDEFCDTMRKLHAKVCNDRLSEAASLIVKPDAGSCSQLIVRIDSVEPAELNRAWSVVELGQTFRNGAFLAEEAVDGREIAVDTVSAASGTRTYVTGYLPRDRGVFYTAGAVVPAHPPLAPDEDRSARTLAAQVHASLGLVPAVTHMEIILPRDGSAPFIVELNPRMGGGALQEMHRLVSGVEFFRIAARLALGNPRIEDLLSRNGEITENADQVLIRFRRPGTGTMAVGNGGPGLRHPFERFRFLQPAQSRLAGGASDDDLLAWCLLGAKPLEFKNPEESYQSLVTRADDLLQRWLPDAE